MTDTTGTHDRLRVEVRFAQVPEWVLYHQRLPMHAKLVYACLQRHGERKFPSHKRMADLLSISVSSVRRGLQALTDEGLLEIVNRSRDDEGQTSNLYLLATVDRSHRAPPPVLTEQAPCSERATKDSKRNESKRNPYRRSADADAPAEGFLSQFWEPYRALAKGRPTVAGSRKRAWEAYRNLTRTDQAAAVESLPAYRDYLQAKDAEAGRRWPAKHASTYLRERYFDDVVRELEDLTGVDVSGPAACPHCSQPMFAHVEEDCVAS